MSRKVWQDPRKGRWMLALLAFYALGAMAVGLLGAYRAQTTVMNQLSLGLVAFGLGMVGLLKTAIEMREHHRLDRAARARVRPPRARLHMRKRRGRRTCEIVACGSLALHRHSPTQRYIHVSDRGPFSACRRA